MTKVYFQDGVKFTSDLHIGHEFIRKLRGYESIDDFHNSLISTWNSPVKPQDDVFILGDIFFKTAEQALYVFNELNGYLYLIKGNHDKNWPRKFRDINLFATEQDYLEIDIKSEESAVKQRVAMLHYAMRSWNRMHYGSWHLYGHSHGNLPGFSKSMDVGLDANDQNIFTYSDIADYMGKQIIIQVDHHVRI